MKESNTPTASFFTPLNHLLSPQRTSSTHSLPSETVALISWWRPPSLPSAAHREETDTSHKSISSMLS